MTEQWIDRLYIAVKDRSDATFWSLYLVRKETAHQAVGMDIERRRPEGVEAYAAQAAFDYAVRHFWPEGEVGPVYVLCDAEMYIREQLRFKRFNPYPLVIWTYIMPETRHPEWLICLKGLVDPLKYAALGEARFESTPDALIAEAEAIRKEVEEALKSLQYIEQSDYGTMEELMQRGQRYDMALTRAGEIMPRLLDALKAKS